MNTRNPEVGPGDAIVRIRATGICGSDLQVKADQKEADESPVGHEVAGEIIAVGDGIDDGMVGARVAIETIGHGRACLRCWYCRMGQYKQCMDMAPPEGGGFAEYIKRKAWAATPYRKLSPGKKPRSSSPSLYPCMASGAAISLAARRSWCSALATSA